MVACAIEINVVAKIIFEWKMFYGVNKKALFLPSLVTVVCKRTEVTLFDADEVLPLNIPIQPFLVWAISISTGKEEGLARRLQFFMMKITLMG